MHTQYVYMTLKKVELSAYSDFDWIIKMQCTLVCLMSNQIKLLMVKLRPLDYSIVSRIKRACKGSDCVESDFCVLRMLEIFPGGREPEV